MNRWPTQDPIDFPRFLRKFALQRIVRVVGGIGHIHRVSTASSGSQISVRSRFAIRRPSFIGSWIAIALGILAACSAAPHSVVAEESTAQTLPSESLPSVLETRQETEKSTWNITGPSQIFVGRTALFKISLPKTIDGKTLAEPVLRLRLSEGLELVGNVSTTLPADKQPAKTIQSAQPVEESQSPRYWYRELTESESQQATEKVPVTSSSASSEPLCLEIRVLRAGPRMVKFLLESETLPVATRRFVINGVEPLNPLPPLPEASTSAKSSNDTATTARSVWMVDPFAQKIFEQTSADHTLFAESGTAEPLAEQASTTDSSAASTTPSTASSAPSVQGSGDASTVPPIPPINLDEVAKTLGPDGNGPGLDAPRSADPAAEVVNLTDEANSTGTANPTNETESTAGTDPWAAADAQKKEPVLGDPIVESMESLIRLRPDEPVWVERVDGKPTQVIVQGEICNRDCMLELFAGLGRHGKDHESIVRCPVLASTVHAALLVCGAQNGAPASWEPEHTAASGTVIEITVFWKDTDGKIQQCRAQEWVRAMKTKEAMKYDWVFAGSQFVENPYTGKVSYGADRDEEFICVSNFPYATLDLPVPSTRDNASLEFETWTERIPPLHTPITLRLRPVLKP
ncbi:MAG: YdjY domain-containing protein [Thermoguttaceae bacterium]|nr:YdjY domain-containing protein [Thermoguttaceae bacterium]